MLEGKKAQKENVILLKERGEVGEYYECLDIIVMEDQNYVVMLPDGTSEIVVMRTEDKSSENSAVLYEEVKDLDLLDRIIKCFIDRLRECKGTGEVGGA